VAKAFEERALAADQHAAVIRDLLVNRISIHDVPEIEPDLAGKGAEAEKTSPDR
jgi:hypothetical protein